MNANNMSDEELDDLFRKSAERYDPPFDPEAWKAMDQKLDGAQGGLAGVQRYVPALLLALVVTVATIWRLINEPGAQTEALVVKEQAQTQPAVSGAAKPNQTALNERAVLPGPEPPAAHYPRVQSGLGAAPQAREATTLSSTNFSYRQLAAPAEKLGTLMPVLTPPQPGIGIAAGKFPAATVFREKSAPAIATDSSYTQTRRERVFLRNVTVALAVAPDLTTVRYKEPDAVSANAGMLVSVPLTNRLRLVSGAIWANKLYKAKPEDYRPSPDYWDGKRLPDVITAKCRVLDIPINLQYKFLERGNNNFAVQVGLSSYIMLNEQYTYTYTYQGREPYSKTQEFSKENHHWFGVQNLSVGYTRNLSPAFFVGAEPFVKIPLASIGEGRVKLTSAGVFFTAGYTLK